MNVTPEYAIRKGQKVIWDCICGTHEVLTWCDDIRATERNADVLLNARKDIGLKVNTGKNYIHWK